MKIKFFISAFALITTLLTGNVKSAFGVIDVGVTAIIQPTCSVVPGIPQSIIVVITNFGNISLTTVPIGVFISGNTPAASTWNGSLAPLTSDTFEFPVQFTFPAGPFSLCSYTMGADANPLNDTTCISCNGVSVSINSHQDITKNKIITWPNPTSGNFILKIEDAVAYKTSITITDILGKEVWKSGFLKPEFNIDLTNEPNGVYLINLKSSSTTINSKLILAK